MLLPHSQSEIIQAYLIAVGQGIAYNQSGNWRTYNYKMPDEGSDKAICTYDTSPVIDGYDHRAGEPIDHHGIMVQVRSTDPNDGSKKARQVLNSMVSLKGTLVTVGTGPSAQDYIVTFARTSGPVPIGEDGRHRHTFSFNGTLTINLRT